MLQYRDGGGRVLCIILSRSHVQYSSRSLGAMSGTAALLHGGIDTDEQYINHSPMIYRQYCIEWFILGRRSAFPTFASPTLGQFLCRKPSTIFAHFDLNSRRRLQEVNLAFLWNGHLISDASYFRFYANGINVHFEKRESILVQLGMRDVQQTEL